MWHVLDSKSAKNSEKGKNLAITGHYPRRLLLEVVFKLVLQQQVEEKYRKMKLIRCVKARMSETT